MFLQFPNLGWCMMHSVQRRTECKKCAACQPWSHVRCLLLNYSVALDTEDRGGRSGRCYFLCCGYKFCVVSTPVAAGACLSTWVCACKAPISGLHTVTTAHTRAEESLTTRIF